MLRKAMRLFSFVLFQVICGHGAAKQVGAGAAGRASVCLVLVFWYFSLMFCLC